MKNILKFILIFFLIYFLALLQSGFLAHFRLFGLVPNLILILIIIVNFWEEKKKSLGIFSAFLGGLFIDVFSGRPFGFDILIYLAIALFVKMILKNYVRIPFGQRA